MTPITQDLLVTLLSYDPETGLLRWHERPVRPKHARTDRAWNAAWAGKIAGTKRPDGYIQVSLGYGQYCRAHQLAWLYMTGEWPNQRMDHINLKRDDNRWCNLRLASNSQSINNQRRRKDNTSGHKGVQRLPNGRYRVRAGNTYLGCFGSKQEAISVYRKAAKAIFGPFARF